MADLVNIMFLTMKQFKGDIVNGTPILDNILRNNFNQTLFFLESHLEANIGSKYLVNDTLSKVDFYVLGTFEPILTLNSQFVNERVNWRKYERVTKYIESMKAENSDYYKNRKEYKTMASYFTDYGL